VTNRSRPWRAARVTAVTELAHSGHLLTQLMMMVVQLALTWWLWQALYAHVRVSAGLNARQATTYALLGTLYIRFRSVDRQPNGDQMTQLMLRGTIAYWFLRPVPPQRYYLIRAIGDLAYGAAWATAGYTVCLAAGLIAPPASAAAGVAALVTMVLGLVVLYYVQQCVDLMCFWSVVNNEAVTAAQFVQNLLSGAFAPLWFFPTWFHRIDGWLPFQATLNVPLSLYVGRISTSATIRQAGLQVAWCCVLAVLTWRLWWRHPSGSRCWADESHTGIFPSLVGGFADHKAKPAGADGIP